MDKIEWPKEFDVLATYNTERRRGIVHTPEWDAKMADLQAAYHEWAQMQWPDYRPATGLTFHRGSFTY